MSKQVEIQVSLDSAHHLASEGEGMEKEVKEEEAKEEEEVLK